MRIQTAAPSLLLILLFCVYLCSHIFVVSGLCLKDQRSLLLQLKSNLTYSQSDSTKLVSWNESIACCEWIGVTCDDEGHVIGLDLSEEYIYGGLPNSSSLFSLQHLQNLNLAYNYFDSVIPFGFNKLENLTYLNLSEAGFVGQVPSEISHMTRLVTLDISRQVLKLEKPNLGDLVRNLINIRRLYLDGVTISAMGEEWNATLLQIPSLQELSMSRCDLSGPLESFPTRLENISVIRLDGNSFLSPVPETFANLKNLTTLSLRDSGLTGMFPQKIFQVPTLSFIDISLNEDLNGFFPDFSLNAYLQNLKVSWTNFSGPLPNSIGNLRNLSTLDLYGSQFNGTLPNALSNLTQLVELDLSFNRFGGSIPSFTLCKKLELLFLDNNQLTGDISSTHFEGLTNLLELYLSNNNMSFIDATTSKSNFSVFPTLSSLHLVSCNLTTFPQFLKNQSGLISLDLSDNHIVGIVPKWIANYNDLVFLNISYNYLTHLEECLLLNNMSDLLELDVHSNQLQGPLPALPPFVEYLDYSSNNLSSFIPPNIGSYLRRTTFVSFSSNNLNGNIPESICNAPNLEVLDLSNNVLTGTIPKCLIAMNGPLAILDLGRNKLNGTIDTFPGKCDLRSLYLNDNSLQGSIPKYLAKCAMLEVLHLGNNQIHDHFPCWLKSISTLSVLVLRSNKLHGSLKCQVAWPHLQIIDLASNNFSGRIPPSFFEAWKAMKIGENYANQDYLQFEFAISFPSQTYYHDRVTVTSKQQEMQLVKILTIFTTVDLSCNKFEGLIPEELGKLNALYILNLSHNVFSGHIPSSLGNLKKLESLDLSSNKLSGEIPTQLASLSFLEVLNLSYNHLEGRIPTSTQIQSFEAASFKGNDGLCGPPLTQNCSGDGEQGTSPPASSSNIDKESTIDWNFLSVELGVTFGIGIILLPLIFCKSWRIWYWEHVDNMLYRIFPQLDFVYEYCGGHGYRTLRWKRY